MAALAVPVAFTADALRRCRAEAVDDACPFDPRLLVPFIDDFELPRCAVAVPFAVPDCFTPRRLFVAFVCCRADAELRPREAFTNLLINSSFGNRLTPVTPHSLAICTKSALVCTLSSFEVTKIPGSTEIGFVDDGLRNVARNGVL